MKRFPTLLTLAATLAILALMPITTARAQAPAPQAPNEEVAILKQRIAELEKQISDLQVLYGTVESFLGQNGGPVAGGAAFNGAGPGAGEVNGRLSALETQIRALSSQMRQLSGGAPQRRGQYNGGNQTYEPAPQPQRYGRAEPALRPYSGDNTRTAAPPPAFDGFSAEVKRNTPPSVEGRPLSPPGIDGEPVEDMPLPPVDSARAPATPVAVAPVNPKALYEQAYGQLLKEDYAGAEIKFAEFLKKHPKNGLAGNAQFWLAESYFLRGQFREAAQNFLKSYQTYKGSTKAPDSLLKLAMSLKKLGKKDAACTTLQELNAKYPNAPNHVRQRATSERQQAGC